MRFSPDTHSSSGATFAGSRPRNPWGMSSFQRVNRASLRIRNRSEGPEPAAQEPCHGGPEVEPLVGRPVVVLDPGVAGQIRSEAAPHDEMGRQLVPRPLSGDAEAEPGVGDQDGGVRLSDHPVPFRPPGVQDVPSRGQVGDRALEGEGPRDPDAVPGTRQDPGLRTEVEASPAHVEMAHEHADLLPRLHEAVGRGDRLGLQGRGRAPGGDGEGQE